MLPIDYAIFPGPITPRLACDLIDFHLRWPEFRPVAMDLLSSGTLSGDQVEILGWLIALSDRVRAGDVG